MRQDSTDYRDIFLNDLPLIDVRAPIEFNKGAFPQAINLPLMNDQERQKVGTCYKRHGQDAAIALGHQLVAGTSKSQRLDAWASQAQAHPLGYIYCLHGGLRSQIVQHWLYSEVGIAYPRIAGGYKAMRNFLIATTDAAVAECDFVLVGGLTGSGKTELLVQLDNAIDLEGHAHHRGSSFGKHATPQPCQVNFENALAIDLLKKRERGMRQFVLEDESRLIGSCSLPLALHSAMQHYPMVWLEDSLDSRIERIVQDYVVKLCAEFVIVQGPNDGFAAFALRLQTSLKNIVKRLGGERYQRLASMMDQALILQQKTGDISAHHDWVAGLLNEYYDPLYTAQREHADKQILFQGDSAAALGFLRHHHAVS
ncbi:MAG: tRNA 2-selenouridine(34) synthase MnmH [Burkholderiaceae bacterium]|nr:tRNA 2-selenouridine(34) synthase MnmH [Burkholderiaceae bacterium]